MTMACSLITMRIIFLKNHSDLIFFIKPPIHLLLVRLSDIDMRQNMQFSFEKSQFFLPVVVVVVVVSLE